jgi:GT2 family glycosyltransferase
MIYMVVPTFGRIEETKKFLSSIQDSVKQKYLVLIIDDHPDKVTYKSIEQDKQIKVLISEKELWWVGSINFGIQNIFEQYSLKGDDIVVFANNDVQIDKDSFELLYDEIEKDKNQIVHPRTFDQDNVETSSGTKIFSFFPYITKHPKNFQEEKKLIDMGSARFLMMSGRVLQKVKYINKELIQYLGDNDFTLSAKKFHNINTYILRDAVCRLDDTQTGIKNKNIQNIKELYKSFFSIKSPNNIQYRYRFFKKFFGRVGSFFIVASMTFNVFAKYTLKKIKIN